MTGMTNIIYEAFEELVREYRTNYNKGVEYTHIKELKLLLFNMLKSLYKIQYPFNVEDNLVIISNLPSDEWIISHIDSLLYDE
jgi:hypothetical protein